MSTSDEPPVVQPSTHADGAPTEPEPESEPEREPEPRPETEQRAAPPVPPTPPPPNPAPKSGPLSPAVEPPSPDVELADETALPGMHRGGFLRLPTAPVTMMTQSAPAEPGSDEDSGVEWQPSLSPAPARRGFATWALAFSIIGLLGSLFVGWLFALGIVGIVMAILALRRPLESRGVAVWALVLGVVSVVYSAGWLLFAADQTGLIG